MAREGWTSVRSRDSASVWAMWIAKLQMPEVGGDDMLIDSDEFVDGVAPHRHCCVLCEFVPRLMQQRVHIRWLPTADEKADSRGPAGSCRSARPPTTECGNPFRQQWIFELATKCGGSNMILTFRAGP